MEALTAELKESSVVKIEGIEFLQHGDLTELAKGLDVEVNTVYRVVNGKYHNGRVHAATLALIEIRKAELTQIVNRVAGIN